MDLGNEDETPKKLPPPRRRRLYTGLGAVLAVGLSYGTYWYLTPVEEPPAETQPRAARRRPGKEKAKPADLEFTPGGHDPVDPSVLARALPEPPGGWRAVKLQRSAAGGDAKQRRSTQAGRAYLSSRDRVEVRLTDWGANKVALLPFLLPVRRQKTSQGFQLNVRRGDDTGKLVYRNASRTGTLTVVVAKRFHLKISTRGVDAQEIQQWWDWVDSELLHTAAGS